MSFASVIDRRTQGSNSAVRITVITHMDSWLIIDRVEADRYQHPFRITDDCWFWWRVWALQEMILPSWTHVYNRRPLVLWLLPLSFYIYLLHCLSIHTSIDNILQTKNTVKFIFFGDFLLVVHYTYALLRTSHAIGMRPWMKAIVTPQSNEGVKLCRVGAALAGATRHRLRQHAAPQHKRNT